MRPCGVGNAVRHSTSWDTLLLKLGLHERTATGMNVHRYAVTGQNRSATINGILVKDIARIFKTGKPQPNPHLHPAT